MINPKNSWDKSDSEWKIFTPEYPNLSEAKYVIGKNDLDLMRRLYQAGPEHRKLFRQVFISMDITAPLYWWKEFELDDFSHEHLHNMFIYQLKDTIIMLNHARTKYLESKDKDYWWQMIQLLPSSYNQKRTVTMNYENVVTMIRQRTGHKLDEWNDFVALLHGLPYVAEIIDE